VAATGLIFSRYHAEKFRYHAGKYRYQIGTKPVPGLDDIRSGTGYPAIESRIFVFNAPEGFRAP